MSAYRYHAPSISRPDELSAKRKFAIWTKYIDAIPWAPGELDHQEFAAFSKAASGGIDQESAFNFVVERMKRAGARSLRLAKIRHSLARAYSSGGDGAQRMAPLQLPPIEHYGEERLRNAVGELAGQVDENFFIGRSPFTTWNRTPAGALHKLFLLGEKVWITANDMSSDGCLWHHEGTDGCGAQWVSVTGQPGGPEQFEPNFACLRFFEQGHHRGVWFLSNPITGEPHYDTRFAHDLSYRCIEAVSSWRYLVLETAVAPALLWLALLAMAPIRIAAIYHSGARGHHALVRIDAGSKPEADDLVESYRREYVPLGACESTLSAFRLTRLPNCLRGQTDRWQSLIYLNPNPTGTPILEQPVFKKGSPPDENNRRTCTGRSRSQRKSRKQQRKLRGRETTKV
jgi:hypothetical protein